MTQKMWCYYNTSKKLDIKLRTEKNLCTFLSWTKHPFVGNKTLCQKTILQQYSRRNKLKIFTFPMENKLAYIANSSFHFRYLQGLCFFTVAHRSTKSLVQQGIAFKKLFSRFYNLFSLRLVVFIDINMYRNTEGRNFKTFLKENYVIV